MYSKKLFNIVDYIIKQGKRITAEYTGLTDLPVDYVHIFAQSKEEQKELLSKIKQLGKVVERPKTGITYQLNQPHLTEAGELLLVNIRFPDPTRPQRGAPDFRVEDFKEFKKQVLNKENINLIQRPNYEMVEIWDKKEDVLVYFLSEPLTVALGLLK